jgi:hypothetical protein
MQHLQPATAHSYTYLWSQVGVAWQTQILSPYRLGGGGRWTEGPPVPREAEGMFICLVSAGQEWLAGSRCSPHNDLPQYRQVKGRNSALPQTSQIVK